MFGFSAGGTAVLLSLMDPSLPVGVAVTINAPTSLNAAVDAVERATKQPYAWSAPAKLLAQRSDAVAHASEIATGHPLPPPAVFLFHGSNDTTIAPDGTAALGRALQPLYRQSDNSQRLQTILAPGVTHTWTADAQKLEHIRSDIAAWFNRYL